MGRAGARVGAAPPGTHGGDRYLAHVAPCHSPGMFCQDPSRHTWHWGASCCFSAAMASPAFDSSMYPTVALANCRQAGGEGGRRGEEVRGGGTAARACTSPSRAQG